MNYRDESSDDDDWRDPHINDRSTAMSTEEAKEELSDTPNDYWVLPPHCSAIDIMGPRRSRLGEIMRTTGVYARYNEPLHQVNLWGDQMAIIKAKKQLDWINRRIAELDTSMLRRGNKWGKPERQMTEKEKIKEEKKQQKIEVEKQYLKDPPKPQPFNMFYYVSPDSVVIERLLRPNESYLNQIRVDCKTFIKYNPHTHTFQLSGNEESRLKMAANRLRNLHLRYARSIEAVTARLIQKPAKNVLLKYKRLPPGFILSEYTLPDIENVLREKQRILETISVEGNNLSEEVKALDLQNEVKIQTLLDHGLESLRLKDWVVRMKIRFGTICLIDFPRKDDIQLTIEQVSSKIFNKERFVSALAPCIGKTEQDLDSLFKYLKTHGDEFSDNPRTSFLITAAQHPSTIPAEERRKQINYGQLWKTQTEITFIDRNKCGLWNTVTHCTDLVDISCFDPEDPYSWDLKLQYARSFPHDDINAPHERFSENSSLSASGRLVLPSVFDYFPEIVTQKTIWSYGWLDFVIEICKQELWDLTKIERENDDLALDLSHIEPHRVLFKVSMYKESWRDRFASNLDLRVGEAPSWTLRDFLVTPKENARTLMHCAKKFGKVLSREVPLYYNKP
ncbi:hypothetical protein G6F56_000628 [Rhizopus delemar]|uniref:DUF7905 domain-containing protein n=1 Tax=Rhizopus stolonifer TaxID=4846 RepID=A0A367KTP8_RHIST|nr:hypothetical protein G6F56_000628 [Rhizopus delemar]RCI05583.1 hypothetical protein CU098_013323 [Rhizopus stolonifer]